MLFNPVVGDRKDNESAAINNLLIVHSRLILSLRGTQTNKAKNLNDKKEHGPFRKSTWYTLWFWEAWLLRFAVSPIECSGENQKRNAHNRPSWNSSRDCSDAMSGSFHHYADHEHC